MKYLRPAYAVVLLLLTAAVLIGVVLWGAYKNIPTLAVMISLFVLFVSYLTAVLLLNKAGKKQLTQNAARFRAALPYAETIRIRHQGSLVRVYTPEKYRCDAIVELYDTDCAAALAKGEHDQPPFETYGLPMSEAIAIKEAQVVLDRALLDAMRASPAYDAFFAENTIHCSKKQVTT